MRHKYLKILLSLLVLLCSVIANAQNRPSDKPVQKLNAPKVTTEFGLGVMGQYSFLETVPIGNFPHNITTNVGYGASLQFRLNIGRFFGIQPEIVFFGSKLKFSSTQNDYKTPIDVKENLLQMPLLLSLRFAMVRINAGPVFRLSDKGSYLLSKSTDDAIEQREIGMLYPMVTYAAGVSVKLLGRMIVDLRYAGQFTDIKTQNAFIWTLDENKQPEAHYFRTRNSSVQLRVGVVF